MADEGASIQDLGSSDFNGGLSECSPCRWSQLSEPESSSLQQPWGQTRAPGI